MTEAAAVPVGRLQGVQREWDFQAGWVRAPLREIVFNDRLSKQARLVWLWLASVPAAAQASWAECETLLRCGTKARRACISQLVIEGFISVHDNGIVTMHDPYIVFDQKRQEIIDGLRDEWQESISLIDQSIGSANQRAIMINEKKLDKQIEKIQAPLKEQPEKPDEPKPTKENTTISEEILSAWNDCRPESYSSMRRLSGKQKECINKHLNNLGLKSTQAKEFICTVCSGLRKSDFWSKQVAPNGRNFNSVFGYGCPQDTKMKNIESLYSLGAEERQESPVAVQPEYTLDQQELIDAYRYSSYNHENNRVRGLTEEAQRWKEHMETAAEQLAQSGVDINDI